MLAQIPKSGVKEQVTLPLNLADHLQHILSWTTLFFPSVTNWSTVEM